MINSSNEQSELLNKNYMTSVASTTYSNCVEDDVSINLLLITIFEIIFSKIGDFILFGLYYCYYKNERVKGINYKIEILPGKLLTDLLYVYLLIYITLPIFPLAVLLIPLINYIEFKYLYFKIRKLRCFYNRISLDVEDGYYLMFMFIISILILCCIHAIFYISDYNKTNYLLVRKKEFIILIIN